MLILRIILDNLIFFSRLSTFETQAQKRVNLLIFFNQQKEIFVFFFAPVSNNLPPNEFGQK